MKKPPAVTSWAMAACALYVSQALAASARSAAKASSVQSTLPLPYTSFTLSNGLKVVVHEDHKTPVVTVQMLYRVGSLDEPAGRHGFAHLFEHLMFVGSEHNDTDYFRTLNDMGATESNGSTTLDRTVYYETVPRAALERALFLESDRMGFLPGALTQAKLDTQVGVVLNEKKQGEDRAFGGLWEQIFADLYPPEHPYHHSTIGDEADLKAATLADVRAWFAHYYGAANATLYLTGDVDPQTARGLAEKYFAEIAPGPAVERLTSDSVPVAVPVRRMVEAQVSAPRLYRHYISPPMGGPDGPALELAVQIFGNGTASRLRHRLVDELGLATAATMTFGEGLVSGQVGFIIDATSPAAVPRIVHELDTMLSDFARMGPTVEELARAKTIRRATLARFLASSFGQNIILARGDFYTGVPDYYAGAHLALQQAVTPAAVRDAFARIVDHGYSEVTVLPLPDRKTAAAGYDRTRGLPALGTPAEIHFPATQEVRLANGMKVVLAQRDTAPTIDMIVQVDTGARPVGGTAPLGQMTMAMLTRGTDGLTPKPLDASALAARVEAIGGELYASAGPDVSRVQFSILPDQLDAGVALLSAVIGHPTFPERELAQYRREQIATLQQEPSESGALGIRALRRALYGERHPYGAATRATEIAAIAAVRTEDLRAWYRTAIRPERTTLFVSGAIPLDRLMPLLEARLGRWTVSDIVPPTPPLPAPAPAAAPPRIILIDKPGTKQAQIFAGRLIAPSGGTDDTAIAAANQIYGGNFTARINMALRGAKGWSYGIGSGVSDARGPRLVLTAGPVQIDRTGDSIAELVRQMRAIDTDQPPTAPELARVVATVASETPGKLETSRDVVGSMADSAAYGRPYGYAAGAAARYGALTLTQVAAATRTIIDPATTIWVIVGDAATIEPQLERIAPQLGLGPIDVRHAGD